MIRRPPISTRTATPVSYTTLFLSEGAAGGAHPPCDLWPGLRPAAYRGDRRDWFDQTAPRRVGLARAPDRQRKLCQISLPSRAAQTRSRHARGASQQYGYARAVARPQARYRLRRRLTPQDEKGAIVLPALWPQQHNHSPTHTETTKT